MNTRWARQRLHRARRAIRTRTALTPPTLFFRRETVWVVTEYASCSAARSPRRSGGSGSPYAGWGELAGKTAEPARIDTVDLLRRVDPPRNPRRTEVSWATVEQSLGTSLPADYRRLIDDRGTGTVADVVVYGPGDAEDTLELTRWLDGIQRLVAALRTITCDHFPPPFFPEAGGILPWGLLHGRHVVGWAVTSDEPDTWPVVVLNGEFDGLTLHSVTATAYLLARLPGPETQPVPIG